MAFTTNCTNKGCYKLNTPYLLEDKVYCSECDGEIPNISQFTKNQMKQNKQVKKNDKSSFSVYCEKCKQTCKPIDDKEIICGNCKLPLDKLSGAFKLMLKTELKKGSNI